MRILITGGSGKLGSALRLYLPDAIAPTRLEWNVWEYGTACRWLDCADIVIHCAAFTNQKRAEVLEHEECWKTNVTGTQNICRAIQYHRNRCRLVYVSTDLVFDATTRNQKEESIPTPDCYYGLTKLLGEAAAATVANHLIVRAPFSEPPNEIAADIAKAALMEKVTGLMHVGCGPRLNCDKWHSLSAR